jgi:cytochrome bd-type quinol oxidase subunit 2
MAHALATASGGLSTGLLATSQNVAHGLARVAVAIAFFVVWIGAAVWAERTSRTVPRRARRWSLCGIAGSFVLALCVVLPWLNLQAQDSPNTWPMALLAALVVAVPSLATAAVIALRRR